MEAAIGCDRDAAIDGLNFFPEPRGVETDRAGEHGWPYLSR
jgi:hypothetical protein